MPSRSVVVALFAVAILLFIGGRNDGEYEPLSDDPVYDLQRLQAPTIKGQMLKVVHWAFETWPLSKIFPASKNQNCDFLKCFSVFI